MIQKWLNEGNIRKLISYGIVKKKLYYFQLFQGCKKFIATLQCGRKEKVLFL